MLCVMMREADIQTMKNFSYFLKEGFANLFTNRIVTLTTLITVVVSLLVIGVFNIISFNIVHISEDFGNSFEFNIFIKDSASSSDMKEIEQYIRSVENVKSVKSKTKAETLKEVKGKMDDAAAIQGLSETDNPFRNSFVVTMTDLSKSDETIANIKKNPQVDSVSNNVETSKKLDSVSKKVRWYTILSYILLSILCLSIVSNIINVSIFSRRKHINIMKYVGATNGFVRTPFVIEGLIIGVLGAVISSAFLSYGYDLLFGNFNNTIAQISLMDPQSIAKSLFLTNTAYGFAIGGIGAFFAVNKHLKV